MNEAYIKLGIAALLPVLATIVLNLLDKKTKFGKINPIVKQVIFGLVFGGLAIIGTEWGIPLNGAQVNCRDAAVIIGGLMFGAPAGIIAGLIGGIERWIAVAWGIGTFTRVACTVSTIIAGFYAAALRKFMFEDKRPGWIISMSAGVVMEVFHLTMVFITNMADPTRAMAVVKACSIPMIVANGLSVMVAAMVLTFITKGSLGSFKRSNMRISQTVQRWLLITVIIAFAVTSFFVFRLQSEIANVQADNLLGTALDDASADIADAKERGLDVQEFIKNVAKNRHIGETGFMVIVNYKHEVVSAPEGVNQSKMQVIDDSTGNMNVTYKLAIDDVPYYAQYRVDSHFYVYALLPEAEALQIRNVALYVNTFMEVLVFGALFALIYMLIKLVVVNRLKAINKSLAKITGGNLDEVVNVRSNEEFATLSDDINSTVETLKDYIAEASARIDKELEFAKNIQRSALPSIFPQKKEFDIFASMTPAKEVGGDFYDFYMTNPEKLHFLIADVSGKGIPAAMFMMRAKTELKSLTEAGMSIDEVFTHGNVALCEGNDAGMFVTAWQGNIDLTTGHVAFANAGHNPPLVYRDGKFDYLKSRAGFVLAGMDTVKYKPQELDLVPGDIIFLYTDGVTEATDANEELFGEDRLIEALNSKHFESAKEICTFVKEKVDEFVGEAPQFDDITMVALIYNGTPKSPSIHFDEVKTEDVLAVTEFVESAMNEMGAPMKSIIQVNVAIDELFSNIVKFAYGGKSGPATVTLTEKFEPHRVEIQFIDEGIPYNPLTQEDPDITLSAEERGIGGLGIYMVKKTMDGLRYNYEDDKNMLTIVKNI